MFRNAQSIPPVLPHLWGPKGQEIVASAGGRLGVYSLTPSYEGQTEFISQPLPLSYPSEEMIPGAAGSHQETGIRTPFPELSQTLGWGPTL